MSKISFVIPTRNRLEWVGECLVSLMEQTEKDIEIFVVNDASDDGTKEFLDEWAVKDPRVKVIHNEIQQGGGKSRNIGTLAASSPIIGVCDDDDSYPEDRASVTLKWFEEHPESELVNYSYLRIGYFGEHLQGFMGKPFDTETFKKTGEVSYFSNPSTAFKKESFVAMGGYPAETKDVTDDYQFVQKWIESGKKIDCDPSVIGVLHRVLPDSMMSKHRGFKPEWVGAK